MTSLDVAETFDKRHADVLRDIELLQCSKEFRERNFALSKYSVENNKRWIHNSCHGIYRREGYAIQGSLYSSVQ